MAKFHLLRYLVKTRFDKRVVLTFEAPLLLTSMQQGKSLSGILPNSDVFVHELYLRMIGQPPTLCSVCRSTRDDKFEPAEIFDIINNNIHEL